MVVKSNFLVEASYRLSAMEQKLILTLATQIRQTDKEFQKYYFNLGELGDFLGVKSNADYAYLREISKNLLSKVLILKKEESTLQTHWLESVEYFDGQGKVAMSFNPELKPFLIQLKNNFTKYNLKYAIHLKSMFSIRIYELLKQYEKIGHREFLLPELRSHLGVKDGEYPLYGNFKAKVLVVAQKELNARTDICFDFEEFKFGRSVGKIKFLIKSKSLQEVELAQAEIVPTVSVQDQEFERLATLLPQDYREKESLRKLLKTWLGKKDFDYVARNIEYANDGSNAVKPGASTGRGSNYRAYLSKALVGDFGLPYKEDNEAKSKAAEEAARKAREEAKAQKSLEEQKEREREDNERARVYQENLSPEALETLQAEAVSRLTAEQCELLNKKTPGANMMLKMAMNKICLERMKISRPENP